ncbi:TOBE domain-containing protein, partial [Elioraea thermophila]|uniref:TOBE domain-containing protein n=1 Tax=Elioraea thermophila TaxID=2185104 RepID=UPI001E377401
IGSPAMNLIEGRMEESGFRAGDGTLWPAPANGAARHRGEAIYGIRPEHLRLDPDGIRAAVQVVEPTGSETQVVLRVGATPLIGAFRERIAARPGDILPVAPDPALIHLFDRSTGRRLH